MDLFKSVLSEYDHHQQQPDSPINNPTSSPSSSSSSSSSSSWSFSNLIKTLATKSESVIGSYRHDFEEFKSELKKETSIIRQVASRAVNELPDSLEIAQESLESVGQAIDDISATVWKSTAKIISHGKESNHNRNNQGLTLKPYNRFETMLLAIQSDKETYVKEPNDSEDYENWSLGFKLEEKKNEIVDLINGNKSVKEIYEKIVPMEVDDESFWRRYFYKMYKLEQVEEARVKLVKRAISCEEDEDLSWDLDDEGDENVELVEEKVESREVSSKDSDISVESREVSSKDSDISVISTQPSLLEVEELGWDKMEEDIRSNEEKFDWRRRVSVVADEEEDLTWDIEDEDDDSVKQ